MSGVVGAWYGQRTLVMGRAIPSGWAVTVTIDPPEDFTRHLIIPGPNDWKPAPERVSAVVSATTPPGGKTEEMRTSERSYSLKTSVPPACPMFGVGVMPFRRRSVV